MGGLSRRLERGARPRRMGLMKTEGSLALKTVGTLLLGMGLIRTVFHNTLSINVENVVG